MAGIEVGPPPAAEGESEVSQLRERIAKLEADNLRAVAEAVKEAVMEERRRVEAVREEERGKVAGEREDIARLVEGSRESQAELVNSLKVSTTCCHDTINTY